MDLFQALMPDYMQVVKHVHEEQFDSITPEMMETFVAKVLAPLRPKLEELLASPRSVALLGRTAPFTKQTLKDANVDSFSEDDKLGVVTAAMAMDVSGGDSWSTWHRAKSPVEEVYRGQGNGLKRMAMGYAEALKDGESVQSMWIHNMISIGFVEVDIINKVIKRAALKPLAQAARISAAYLLAGKTNAKAIGVDGGEVIF